MGVAWNRTGRDRHRTRRACGCRVLSASVTLVLCAACAEEREVVAWNPPLAGLPGAQPGMAVKGGKGGDKAAGRTTGVREYAPGELRIENDDGSITLVASTGKHLIMHIVRTLRDDDEALFTEQVLSQMTKNEFIARGYDPSEAFRELKRREADAMKLFYRMPNGELTPGVFLKRVGDDVYRMQAGGARGDLRWTYMDMVYEGGNWRLRWFG